MEACECCGEDKSNSWLDRTRCSCRGDLGWGPMHTRCAECGYAYGDCKYEATPEPLATTTTGAE